jgi:hypothetical protein
MCLISALSIKNEDGEEEKILLESEKEVFEQIKQKDLPMVVVAVVGLYRTGKSYLMNCLAESSKGTYIPMFVNEVVMCHILKVTYLVSICCNPVLYLRRITLPFDLNALCLSQSCEYFL